MISAMHYAHRPDGSLERHDGPVGMCGFPECEWPRIGSMVTIISGGRRVTGSLSARTGNLVEVKTPDGSLHRGPRVTVMNPEWGAYCPHGRKIVEAVEAEHTCQDPQPDCERSDELGHLRIGHKTWCRACCPDGRKILPWPCDRCTEAAFDQERQDMEEQYWEEMRREAYGY